MAVFSEAYMKLVPIEGGYANVANDKGGETYAGISRKYFPDWRGWPIVDRNKPLKKNQKVVSSDLAAAVVEFYEQNFWSKVQGTYIQDQQVANFIFDFAVNSARAVKRIQGVLGLSADGIVGKQTLAKINEAGAGLLPRLKADRLKHINEIIENDPTQEKFRKGWINRVNSF